MKRVIFFIFVFSVFFTNSFATDLMFLQKEVEKIRGLKFKEEIKFEYISQKQVSNILNKELSRQYTEKKLENYETALKVFGLIPKKSNLKDLVQNLMNSQVAGIYDNKSKKMYILETSKELNNDEFFKLSSAFNLDDIMIVHELTHALTDQNFNLEKSLKLDNFENEDKQIAGLSVAEGDAILVMVRYLLKTMNVPEISLFNFEDFMGDSNFYGQFLGETIPRYLRETLIFPYTSGLKFVSFISKGEDFKKIDLLYLKTPASTEEVIHPEKYINQNDKPIETKINWFDLKKKGASEKIWEGTWGELGTKIILQEWKVNEKKAILFSEGWGGDRYIVYKNYIGEFLFFWKTIWDSEKDAIEFEDALKTKKDLVVLRIGKEVTVELKGKIK